MFNINLTAMRFPWGKIHGWIPATATRFPWVTTHGWIPATANAVHMEILRLPWVTLRFTPGWVPFTTTWFLWVTTHGWIPTTATRLFKSLTTLLYISHTHIHKCADDIRKCSFHHNFPATRSTACHESNSPLPPSSLACPSNDPIRQFSP